MERLFGKPIVTQEQIRARIRELGREITVAYRSRDLILVGILKGSFAFYADLSRAIRLPLRVDFLLVSRYRPGTRKPGKVKLLTDLTEDIKDRDVLFVEDIVDSGRTVQYLMQTLRKRNPRTIRVCTLLSKTARRQINVRVDFIGFEMPNVYVVGYGLDYQQKYRNLPYLAVLDPRVLENEQT